MSSASRKMSASGLRRCTKHEEINAPLLRGRTAHAPARRGRTRRKGLHRGSDVPEKGGAGPSRRGRGPVSREAGGGGLSGGMSAAVKGLLGARAVERGARVGVSVKRELPG